MKKNQGRDQAVGRSRFTVGLLILVLLALPVVLGKDKVAFPLPEEIKTRTIAGFFLAQEIQARRCDEFLAQQGLTAPQASPASTKQSSRNTRITFQMLDEFAKPTTADFMERTGGSKWKKPMPKPHGESNGW